MKSNLTSDQGEALMGTSSPPTARNTSTSSRSDVVLPPEVIERDKTLDKAIISTTSELMELRWHWTRDKDNPARVTTAAYARAVGRARPVISRDANAWAQWLASQSKRTDIGTLPVAGQPQTPGDFRELAKLSDERQHAVAAIARATGKEVSNVAANMRHEVNHVLVTAQADAIQHGTSIEAEVDRVAEWQAKMAHEYEKKSAALSKAGKNRWTQEKAEQLTLESRIAAARTALGDLLDAAEGISARKAEAIKGAVNDLRTIMDKIEASIHAHSSHTPIPAPTARDKAAFTAS
jgi:hypothetical protein